MEWPLSVSREEHTSERDIVVYTGRKRVSMTGHGKAPFAVTSTVLAVSATSCI